MTQPESNNLDDYSRMINNKIEHFRNLMTAGYKTGGTMPLDSAVWNLEALISYDNAYPDSASKNFVIMSATFTMPVNENNLVSETDVQTVYQEMLDTINAQLITIENPVKFLVFSDVKTDSVVNGTAFLTSNNGYGSDIIPGMYDPFTDDWIWGFEQGLCSPPPGGTNPESDGSDEIEYRLNNPNFNFQGSGPYTDYETIEVDIFNCSYYDGTPRVFSTSNFTDCMEINELDYYLNEANTIIYSYNDPSNDGSSTIYIYEVGEGARPADKDFISIEITDEIIVGNLYLHHYYITYAKPFISQQ